MEKPTVENKVKEIAEAMGLTYLCESWFRANQAFDRFRRQGESREVTHPDGLTLPACLYVQPVAGFLNFTSQGFVRDAPSCLISFADAMPLDYKGADAQEIAERLKGLAVRFIVAVNESGFFVPVAGQINYRVAFDKMDAHLPHRLHIFRHRLHHHHLHILLLHCDLGFHVDVQDDDLEQMD